MPIGSLLLALTPQPAGTPPAPLWFQMVPILLIMLIIYFLMIAPVRKKQKKHQEMLTQLKQGDRVLTNGGIYGTVVGVAEHVVQLRIADQVKIDVAKSAVADLVTPES